MKIVKVICKDFSEYVLKILCKLFKDIILRTQRYCFKKIDHFFKTFFSKELSWIFEERLDVDFYEHSSRTKSRTKHVFHKYIFGAPNMFF